MADILKIDQVLPLKEGELFNLEKIRQLYEPLKLLYKATKSKTGYDFPENPIIQAMISSVINLDEDQLFQLSYKIEPVKRK